MRFVCSVRVDGKSFSLPAVKKRKGLSSDSGSTKDEGPFFSADKLDESR
jgi:hypothetical protein